VNRSELLIADYDGDGADSDKDKEDTESVVIGIKSFLGK